MPVVTDPNLVQQLDALRPKTEPKEKPSRAPKRIGDFTEAAVGTSQGLLNPIEGSAQFIEAALRKFAPGAKIAPDAIRNWARNWRNRAESSYTGIGGEVLGSLLPLLLTRNPANITSILGRAGVGALAAGAQPVSGGGDYWRTKAEQAASGAFIGGAVPPLASLASKAPSAVLHGVGLPAWLAHRVGTAVGAPVAAVGRTPSGPYGLVAGELEGQHPYERADEGEEPAPARTPASAPERPLPSWLTGLVTQAQLYGGRDAETDQSR